MKSDHVFVDETVVSYQHHGSINIAAVGIGFIDYSEGYDNPQLKLYVWDGIARFRSIKSREWDVLGMIVADRLVDITKPGQSIFPSTYNICRQIERYTTPYLKNHDWREKTRYETKIAKVIAKRIRKVDCDTEVKGVYYRKQRIGKMVKNLIQSELVIPRDPLEQMIANHGDILNIRTLRFIEPESVPPPGYLPKSDKW